MIEKRESLKWKEKNASMACVYASPEQMGRIGNADNLSEIYPYNYSLKNENAFAQDNMAKDIYGPPEMIRDYANGNNCGNSARTTTVEPHETPMACVYASPSMMGKMGKTKSFLARLFKRKK